MYKLTVRNTMMTPVVIMIIIKSQLYNEKVYTFFKTCVQKMYFFFIGRQNIYKFI